MMSFITGYLGTVAVSLLLLAIISGIIIVMVKSKKKGKCIGCDNSCGNCPSASSCKTDS